MEYSKLKPRPFGPDYPIYSNGTKLIKQHTCCLTPLAPYRPGPTGGPPVTDENTGPMGGARHAGGRN